MKIHDDGIEGLMQAEAQTIREREIRRSGEAEKSGWDLYRGEYVDMDVTSASERSPNIKDVGDKNYNSETGVALKHPLELMTLIMDGNQWADLGVRVISSNCAATAPLFRIISKEDGRNKRVKANKVASEITELLLNPNPIQTGYQLMLETFYNLAIYGNAYWQIVKNRAGKVHSIYLLPAENMRVVPGIDADLNLTLAYYQMNIVSPQYEKNALDQYGKKKTVKKTGFLYTDDEIVHFKTPNERSAVYGKPPLYTQMTQITTNALAQNAINTWFNEGWQAGAIFRLDGDPETVKRNREFLRENYTGSENAGRVLLLGGKAELVSDGNKFGNGIEFDNIMKIGSDSILNCLGVPLSMAGVRSSQGTINSELIASEENVFKRSVVDYYHELVFGQITKTLFRKIMGIKNLEIVPGTLSKFNLKFEIDAVRALTETGASVGEIRQMFGMPNGEIDESVLNEFIVKTNNGVGKATDVLGINFATGERVPTLYERQAALAAETDAAKAKSEGTPIGGKTKLPEPSAGQLGLGGPMKDAAEGKF